MLSVFVAIQCQSFALSSVFLLGTLWVLYEVLIIVIGVSTLRLLDNLKWRHVWQKARIDATL